MAPIAARSLRLTASARWPMAAGGVNAPIEMHAFDERVDGQHLEMIALRLDDRRIVADADEHPGGRRRQPRLDAAMSSRSVRSETVTSRSRRHAFRGSP